MSAAAAEAPETAPSRKKKPLVLIALVLMLGAGGFASTYLGFWSPTALLSGGQAHPESGAASLVVFVDVPPVQLNIPGSRGRSLLLAASIETDETHRAQIEHLMPRVLDAFTGFLSGVDPGAYDKRGVLEIIRAELVTRSRYVLGEAPVKDLLITEFLIR